MYKLKLVCNFDNGGQEPKQAKDCQCLITASFCTFLAISCTFQLKLKLNFIYTGSGVAENFTAALYENPVHYNKHLASKKGTFLQRPKC